jgi:hypothetical protein
MKTINEKGRSAFVFRYSILTVSKYTGKGKGKGKDKVRPITGIEDLEGE